MSKITNNQKLCSKCNNMLNTDEFYFSSKVKCGLSSQCKKCSNTYTKVGKYYLIDGKKSCSKCSQLLPITEFYENFKIKSGLSSQCKLCNPKKVKKEKLPPKEKKLKYKDLYPVINGRKICYKCMINKPIDRFNLNDKKNRNLCKECKLKKFHQWKLNNPEKYKNIEIKRKEKIKLENKKKKEEKQLLREQKLKEFNLKKELRKAELLQKQLDKEKRSEEYKKLLLYWNSDEYKQKKNKRKKERKREIEKNKMSTNPFFAFKKKLRNNIRKAILSRNYSKNSNAAKILGASWNEIYSYFESKFQPGMTWENHGEWHIDHVIPLASAKSEEELLKLNHYTNLQPLWANENLLKGDKLL